MYIKAYSHFACGTKSRWNCKKSTDYMSKIVWNFNYFWFPEESCLQIDYFSISFQDLRAFTDLFKRCNKNLDHSDW